MRELSFRLLPESTNGKVAAIFSYFVAAIGILLSVLYFVGPGESCIAPNKSELVGQSVLIGLVQLIAGIGLVILTRSLNRNADAPHRIRVVIAAIILLVLQLLFVTGYSFSVGTACTT